jgi:hypothetical protein
MKISIHLVNDRDRARVSRREHAKTSRVAFLECHLIPTLLNPKGYRYVIGHHNLLSASGRRT